MKVELTGKLTKVEAWDANIKRQLTGIRLNIALDVGYASVVIPISEGVGGGQIGDRYKVTVESVDSSEEE